MKGKTIGFLGFGNMASAMAQGISLFCPEMDGELGLLAWSPSKNAGNPPPLPPGVALGFAKSAEELVKKSDFVVLAMKPYQAEEALSALGRELSGKAVISLMGGAWDFESLKGLLPKSARILRIMPNTPAAVGRGAILLEKAHSLTKDEWDYITRIFSHFASLYELPAEKFDAATAISGCGPAFLYMVIEALGDAGVKNGLARKLAYDLAATTVMGAGRMALGLSDLNEDLPPAPHPGELKDAVCSPGGTTIKGVCALEEAGLRSAFIKAVDAVLS